MHGLTVRWSLAGAPEDAAPVLIEPCAIVAVAEGGEGSAASAAYR